jgi:hypothetical protein
MGYRHLILLALLTGCPVPHVTFEPAPKPTKTPCQQACDRLRELSCEEGKPTPGGTPCERVCEDAKLPAACVAQITTCAEIPTCP